MLKLLDRVAYVCVSTLVFGMLAVIAVTDAIALWRFFNV